MTTATAPEVVIPGDDVQVVGGSKAWRFANGKIVRGQEIVETVTTSTGQTTEVKTGNYPEEKKKLIGLLRRIGIYSNHGKYGKVLQLEADIETTSGMEHVKASLLDTNGQFKAGISAVNFAWCLLQFEKDGPMMIETVQGEPVTLPNGTKGGRPTYVNALRVEGNVATPIFRPKRDPNAPKKTLNDQWEDLEFELKKHPAYAERPAGSDVGEDGIPNTHLAALCQEMKGRGWPTPDQAPAEWLAMVAKSFKVEAPATLSGFTDEQWQEVRHSFSKLTKMPMALEPAAVRLAATKAPAAATQETEEDPFA